MKSLGEFIVEKQAEYPHARGSLSGILAAIRLAAKVINRDINRAGLVHEILGDAGAENVQGEQQKKLDVFAHKTISAAFFARDDVAGFASEEEENFIAFDSEKNRNAKYIVLTDPLDGSSNIDVNISVGTIFSILEKPEGNLETASFLQKGRDQVAAGYVLYGPQTQLVLTVGHGVSVFTLDEDGNFVMTKENPRVPETTKEFAINMSNRRHWLLPVQRYIDELLAGETDSRGKNYNMRWVASMVAEIHRILMRGGVFMYPQDKRDLSKPGKLRLMYEANPMSLILEQAGGAAFDGQIDMLDVEPVGLHQRVAVFMGSKEEVDYIRKLHQA